jgi:hypothetical protein
MVHVEVGVSLVSGASWVQPTWTHWAPYPTLGVGLNTRPSARSGDTARRGG